MTLRDSPAPARSAGVLVLVALAAIIVLRKGLATVDVSLD